MHQSLYEGEKCLPSYILDYCAFKCACLNKAVRIFEFASLNRNVGVVTWGADGNCAAERPAQRSVC